MQIFVNLAENTDNVSHKIFHKPQIPGLCGFITARAIDAVPQGCRMLFTRTLLQASRDTENRIAPTVLNALSCEDSVGQTSCASRVNMERTNRIALDRVQIDRGPRSNRTGSNSIAASSPKTPCTAIPTIRNGSIISHTKG